MPCYCYFKKKNWKFANIDENNDDLPDRITFKAIMNVNASSLRNIDVFLFFNYGLRVKFKNFVKIRCFNFNQPTQNLISLSFFDLK